MKTKNRTINVAIPEDLHRKIKHWADCEGIKFKFYVEVIIHSFCCMSREAREEAITRCVTERFDQAEQDKDAHTAAVA